MPSTYTRVGLLITTHATEIIINEVTQTISIPIGRIGNFINDKIGDVVNRSNKGVITNTFQWLGNLIGSSFDLAANMINAGGAIASGLIAGSIQIMGGVISLDSALIKKGAESLLLQMGGAAIIVTTKFIALIQALIGLEHKRKLNSEEIEIVNLYFRGAVSPSIVTVVPNWVLFNLLDNRFLTLGNTIYGKSNEYDKFKTVFTHEIIHVQQNRYRGPIYTAQSLYAQFLYGWAKKGAYEWETFVKKGYGFLQLNNEAQATFIDTKQPIINTYNNVAYSPNSK